MVVEAAPLQDGQITIRDATAGDAGFLAWVMQAAARSHLQHSIWQYLNGHSEEEAISFLTQLVVTEPPHLFQHSLFLVAEVDGQPAAALCGYDPVTEGFETYQSAAGPVYAASGIAFDAQFEERVAAIMDGIDAPAPEPRWIVENVATLPTFRRRGLVDALLTAVLQRGRDRGFRRAQIGVYLGNDPARAAYLKAGFAVESEKRGALWEAAMGSPGTERLVRDL